MPFGGKRDDGSINVDLGVNTTPFTKGMEKAQTTVVKTTKVVNKLDQAVNAVADDEHKNSLRGLKDTKKQLKPMQEQQKMLSRQLKKLYETEFALKGMARSAKVAAIGLREQSSALGEMKAELKELKAVETESGKARKKALEEGITETEKNISGLKKTVQQQERLQKSVEETRESVGELRENLVGKEGVMAIAAIDEIRDEAEKARKDLTKAYLGYSGKKAGEGIGEGFKDVLAGIGAKDMKGMASGLGKALGSGAKGMGAGMARFSAKTKEDATAGGMAKAMGAVAGQLGGMVGMFAKMGPLISMTAGLVVGLVKTLMDAEAAAKEFNKDLLSTASTSEFLAKSGGDANAAYYNLRDTVDSIRDASVDWKANMDFGITKKTHLEFLNTLNAEGVSLQHIKDDATAAKKTAGEFSAEMVHVGVAYSRNFGVSLSEISTFTGEMMREMGGSLDSVSKQFAMMSEAASESGISSNKFFAIMRGMSADLSLFNMRLEDAATTMKLLSKSMNPKNAEAFMKTITGFYKQMDLQGRIKATILGGVPETKGRLQKDYEVNIKAVSGKVAEQLGGDVKAEDVDKAIRGGPKALSDFLSKNQKKFGEEGMSGLKDAMYDTQAMGSKLQHGDLISVASALKDASPVTAMEQMQGIAMKMTGKKLDQLYGVDLLAAGNLLGMSDDQIQQAGKAQKGIDQMRSDLIAQLKTNSDDLSKDQQSILKKLKINGKDADAIAKVQAMDNRTLWSSMTDAQKDVAKPAKTALDFAQDQAKMTSSMADKLEVIADYLLNLVFKGIMLVLDAMPGASKEREQARIQQNIMKSGNKELRDAWEKSGGDTGKFHGTAIMDTDIGKKSAGILMNTASEIKALREKQAELVQVTNDSSKSAEEQAEANRKASEIDKQIDAKREAYSKLSKGVMTDIAKGGDSASADALKKAMLSSGIASTDESQGRMLSAVGNVATGMDWEKAMEQAGFSEEEIAKAMGKALWSLSPEQVAGIFASQAKAGAAPEQPSAQSSAAVAASAPGTGGATVAAAAPPQSTPTAATQGPPAPAAPEVKTTAEATVTTAEHAQRTTDALENIDSRQGEIVKALLGKTPPGLRLGKPMDGWAEDGIEKPVLKAMRQGLFEYWLYKDDKFDETKIKEVATTFGGGKISGTAMIASQMAFLKDKGIDVEGNAAGGVVAGAAGGLAKIVRPAPGEALASVGKGERILPAGAGGGGAIKVELSFKDDMDRYIQAKVLDTTYESKRRERNH